MTRCKLSVTSALEHAEIGGEHISQLTLPCELVLLGKTLITVHAWRRYRGMFSQIPGPEGSRKKKFLQSNRMNYSERSRGKGTDRHSYTHTHTHTCTTQREIWMEDEKGVVGVYRAAAASHFH